MRGLRLGREYAVIPKPKNGSLMLVEGNRVDISVGKRAHTIKIGSRVQFGQGKLRGTGKVTGMLYSRMVNSGKPEWWVEIDGVDYVRLKSIR